MPSGDKEHMIYATSRMSGALSAIRGNEYKVQQPVGLYLASETSDDYAYSRCFVDKNEEKVYAFCIEFGNEFVPLMAEMKNIIKELCSVMTELCLVAMDKQ